MELVALRSDLSDRDPGLEPRAFRKRAIPPVTLPGHLAASHQLHLQPNLGTWDAAASQEDPTRPSHSSPLLPPHPDPGEKLSKDGISPSPTPSLSSSLSPPLSGQGREMLTAQPRDKIPPKSISSHIGVARGAAKREGAELGGLGFARVKGNGVAFLERTGVSPARAASLSPPSWDLDFLAPLISTGRTWQKTKGFLPISQRLPESTDG
nr:uncharacterized protein LOC118084902 [Zootoca vivipara]